MIFNWFGRRAPPPERPRPPFPYPYEIVHGAEALTVFEAIKASGERTPVILGEVAQLDRFSDGLALGFAEGQSPESIERQAESYRFPDDHIAKKARDWAALKEKYPDLDDEQQPEMGEWPETATAVTRAARAAIEAVKLHDPAAPPEGLTVVRTLLTGAPLERVVVATLPTRDMTLIPAYLAYGGWNECPDPHVHVAALRRWRDHYGAELVGVENDRLNIRVARRPQTREEALALAREHYEFCSDCIFQGSETLANHAAQLMDSDWWFFWWD